MRHDQPRQARLVARPLLRQLTRFLTVGGVCTGTYMALFLVLAHVVSQEVANTFALVISAVLNTALNRRHTFGVTGRAGVLRAHSQGMVILVLNWVITTFALVALRHVDPHADHLTQLLVLTVANAIATAMRYLLLRFWVFRPSLTR